MRTRLTALGFVLSLVVAVATSWGLAAQYTVLPFDAVAIIRIDRTSDNILFVRVVDGQIHGLVGPPQGDHIDLGLLPNGTFLYPFSMHEGHVVGMASTGPYGLYTHGFGFETTTGLVDLGTAGGPELYSVAMDLNSTDIFGYGTTPTSAEVLPFWWKGGTVLTVLATLGGSTGWINAANEAGVAVGTAATAAGVLHAALWKLDGTVLDLHTLAEGTSVAVDINTAGKIAGDVQTPDGMRGFVTTGDGSDMTVLRTLPGDAWAGIYSINEGGESVGHSAHYHMDPADPAHPRIHERATAWDVHGMPVDLAARVVNGTGWLLDRAQSINTAGIIVGMGTYQGMTMGFVLMPEEATGRKPQPRTPRPPRRGR
jgi:uncharacterized membrane protein